MTAYNFSQILPDAMNAPRYEPGKLYFVEFQYSAASTALVQNDTITTPSGALPLNGITIAEIELITNAIDTNASPTAAISVGDAGSSNRFISSGLVGSAVSGAQLKNFINIKQASTAGVVTAGSNYIYVAGTAPVLVATVSAAVATGNAAPIVRLKVWYWCTGNAS